MLRRHARKVGVFIAGWAIVIVGLALVPLPGPGWAIVFVGLSLLATEFAWAARLKTKVQDWLVAWVRKFRQWREDRRARRTGTIAARIDVAIEDVLDDVEVASTGSGREHKGAGRASGE